MFNLMVARDRIRRIQEAHECASPECRAGTYKRWSRRNIGVHCNGDWFCSEECMESAVERLVASSPCCRVLPPSAHRLPLGLLMLSRGLIDETQLKSALAVQSERPAIKIGQCLAELGAVSEIDVTRALGAQNCLPVLIAYKPDLVCGIPLALLESARCLGFRGTYHPGLLYLGFESVTDRSLLEAVETILGLPCEPCIAPSHVIEEHLEVLRHQKNSNELLFEVRNARTDIVRSIRS